MPTSNTSEDNLLKRRIMYILSNVNDKFKLHALDKLIEK